MESSSSPTKTLLLKLNSIGNLEDVIESDPDQLQYWYEQLGDLDVDVVETERDLALVCNAMRLVMAYEHTNAEELKDIAEREAVEMAEKEENWELERDMLKEEISGLRERITSKAGIDETNEAFRAEIDSLSAENSYLKQQARERDREASDTRDKVEELSSKLEQLEKEKQLYISQQLQLEDSIRELNRRLSTKSDAPQRTEWETKKLRQRNEQALVLSNQLQNVISQNDKLKEQVESLTSALSDATRLIEESSKKQADLGDQLTFADKTIEKLLCENQELKQQLSEKEGVLTESLQKVDLSSKEYLSLLQSKDAHIEELRTSLQKQMVETEELAARLVTEGGDTEERDKELDKLRMELVQATEAARKLFTDFSLPASGDGREEGKMAMEAQLRVRLLQLDQEVDGLRERLKMAGDEKRELECTCEQKDLANARLSAENQRIRKMAFGDAETEVHRLEMQLKFRDSQIERLNRMCSLLQIELQEYKEEGGGEEGAVKKRRKSRLPKLDEPAPKKKPRSDEETQAELVGGGSSGNVEEAFTILSRRVEEDKRQDEVAGEIKLELEVADEPKGTEEEDLMKPLYFVKPQTREELEANAVLINSLYTELRNLIRELEESRKEVETERLMKSESQKQLLSAKLAEAKAGDELDAMRTSLLGDRASTDDEDALGSRIEALEIELMELRRMEENLKLAGTERERRIAESTRRLIYLAIENAQLNRRTEASKRLRTVLGEEISRLNSRLRRLVAGDGARARQLMVENEINLIEIARLQQSLLHSVPLSEYKRLSREHKYLLAKETIAGAEGEHVKLLEEDDQVDQSQFDISKSAAYFSVADHSADELMKRNRRLDEMNSVLEEQNLSWKAENQRLVTEVGELEAFLDDIESQSDMKSMIVNIERRFLQAISGQLSFAEEGASTEREVARLNEQLRNSRTEWRRERTQLVNVIIQMARQNRHLHAMTPIIPITNQQLASFKRSLESVMESEAQVEKRLRELADAESQLAERRAVVESTWSSIQTLVENDFQLEYIRTSLQGYQLSVITLTGELNATKKELAKYKGSNEELVAELGELRDELNQFHFSNVELSLWRDVAGGEFASASPDRAPKSRPIQRDGDDVGEEAHDRGESVEWDEANEGASEPVRHQDPGEVSPEMESPRHVQAMPERSSDELEVIADTTHGQIEEERQTALELCIQNYKEQLERKDQSIEEYRELVETFQMQLLTTAAVTGGVEDEAGRGRHISRQTKSADEIVGTDHRIEERDKRIIAMEVELCELTASNGELADRLQQLIKSKREERRRTMLEVGVQADFSTDTRTVNSPANMDEREDEKGSVLAQQQAPEESKSNSSDEEDVEGEDEEDTDSGTVEDMEQQATSSRPPHIRRTSSRSSLEESKREKASTSTTLRKRPSSAAPAAAKASAGREEEELVLKHRSEVRRLRMRIAALERKNKQFMEENMALKERSRRYPLTRRVYEPGEESNLLVRDNDRLTRENRNLAKTLKERKEELEELQKQLKRTQTGARTRVSVDGWEERKRLEQTITGLKSKLVECEARESTLKDRLERHERHIELMNKNQASRYVDMERFNKLAREWREEKALLEERESAMRSELQSWPERYRDASFRLEMLMKENKSLHSRVETLHYEMEERSIRQRMPSLISASVQTGVDLVKKRDAAMQVESQEKRKAADAIADKQLRRAELMVQETKQELGTLRTEYDKLLRDYNRLLVLKSKSNDEELEKIASMELLRDKLAAKDTEIGHQRHVIMELEKRLWQFQLDH